MWEREGLYAAVDEWILAAMTLQVLCCCSSVCTLILLMCAPSRLVCFTRTVGGGKRHAFRPTKFYFILLFGGFSDLAINRAPAPFFCVTSDSIFARV